jgi:hypothetical protein
MAPLTGHDTDRVERLPTSALMGVYDVTRALPA